MALHGDELNLHRFAQALSFFTGSLVYDMSETGSVDSNYIHQVALQQFLTPEGCILLLNKDITVSPPAPYSLSVGDSIGQRDKFLYKLIEEMGYNRSTIACEPSLVAVRGGNVDIVTPFDAWRISFNGDVVSSIRSFCTETQMTLQTGIESVSLYSFSTGDSLFSYYLPEDTITITDDPEALPEFLARKEVYTLSPFGLSSFASEDGIKAHKISYLAEGSLLSSIQRAFGKKKIFLCCPDKAAAANIERSFEKDYTISHIDRMSLAESLSSIYTCVCPLDRSLETEDAVFIKIKETRKAAKANKFSDLINSIDHYVEKDYIVHQDYGIGRFCELLSMDIGDCKRDFIKLEYANSEYLYIPVENIDLIKKYGYTADVLNLDSLQSIARWRARKEKVKKKLFEIAEKLIETAAARKEYTKDPILYDEQMYAEFCARFPHELTEDQHNAINDVLDDLASTKVMDRMICGDVGFGKTEVALRTACAVLSSYTNNAQVAVIAPTTLLAAQHYKTFSERMKGMPVKIAHISSFISPYQRQKARKLAAEGKIDIVIGTHAILGCEFKNLKLLVIDEEQLFGVMHKEKLKTNDTNILTLTATPIPRTMQIVTAGITNCSLITTPPVDRLPIHTKLGIMDWDVITEAIEYEKKRSGTVYFITPRIVHMDELHRKLKLIFPKLRITCIHARMEKGKIEEIIEDFYSKKIDVLLSTNIVEAGLDIPHANTIVVHEAQMFGLSRLHQLRGRIGRGNVQGFAYFFIPKHHAHKVDVIEKLKILELHADLGSGFQIAANDMEFRGYGNLIGSEQSGHVKNIGIEMYNDMLEEAVAKLTQTNYNKKDFSPVLNLGLSFKIPDDYIEDQNIKIGIYKRLMQARAESELTGIKEELLDRFGALAKEVENLFDITTIRINAIKANVSKITYKNQLVSFEFFNDKPNNTEVILDIIRKNAKIAKLRPDNKLVVFIEEIQHNNLVRIINKVLEAIL